MPGWLHGYSGRNDIMLIQNRRYNLYETINQVAVVALQNTQFIYPTRWARHRFQASHSFLNELNTTTTYFNCFVHKILFDISSK